MGDNVAVTDLAMNGRSSRTGARNKRRRAVKRVLKEKPHAESTSSTNLQSHAREERLRERNVAKTISLLLKEIQTKSDDSRLGHSDEASLGHEAEQVPTETAIVPYVRKLDPKDRREKTERSFEQRLRDLESSVVEEQRQHHMGGSSISEHLSKKARLYLIDFSHLHNSVLFDRHLQRVCAHDIRRSGYYSVRGKQIDQWMVCDGTIWCPSSRDVTKRAVIWKICRSMYPMRDVRRVFSYFMREVLDAKCLKSIMSYIENMSFTPASRFDSKAHDSIFVCHGYACCFRTGREFDLRCQDDQAEIKAKFLTRRGALVFGYEFTEEHTRFWKNAFKRMFVSEPRVLLFTSASVSFFVGEPLSCLLFLLGPGSNGKSWLGDFVQGFFVDRSEEEVEEVDAVKESELNVELKPRSYASEGVSVLQEPTRSDAVGRDFHRLAHSRAHFIKEYRAKDGPLSTGLVNTVTGERSVDIRLPNRNAEQMRLETTVLIASNVDIRLSEYPGGESRRRYLVLHSECTYTTKEACVNPAKGIYLADERAVNKAFMRRVRSSFLSYLAKVVGPSMASRQFQIDTLIPASVTKVTNDYLDRQHPVFALFWQVYEVRPDLDCFVNYSDMKSRLRRLVSIEWNDELFIDHLKTHPHLRSYYKLEKDGPNTHHVFYRLKMKELDVAA